MQKRLFIMFMIALLLLAAIPAALANDGAINHTIEVDEEDTFPTTNPCTGEDGTVTLSTMGTVRETIAPNGSAHIRGHLYRSAIFTPDGASNPTFFGEDTFHFTENVNLQNVSYNDFFHLSAADQDGTGTFLSNYHFSMNANGEVNEHEVVITSGICD